jgi:hypothetical protein
MQEESIQEKYEHAFTQAAAMNPVFTTAAREQMAQMVEVFANTHGNIDNILTTNQSAAVKGGFIAEEFHAGTFNADAVLKGDKTRALTDAYDQWYEQEWNGAKLKTNDNTDVVLVKDGEVVKSHQLKYNKNAHDTAGELSKVADGKAKYEKNDNYIAPSDQVEDVKIQSKANIKKNIERGGDPAQREAYQQTHDKVTDKVTHGKTSSSPLSKEEANQMGAGDKSKLEKIENTYKTQSTLQQMGNAAVGAASMSAVVSGSINTLRYIQLAREGKITRDQAVIKIVGETVAAAADSAVKASANVGVQSLIVRYGSEKAVVEILAKQGLKSMLRSNAVTVGVVCAVDAVKDLVRLGTGDISQKEFFERQGKGVLQTSAGVVGGSLGLAGASAAATAFGVSATGTAMTVAGVVGGLSGGLIAGLAMSLAIENGIEKPYRDLVRNTGQLQEAAHELERVSRTVFMGQVLFGKFLEQNAVLENGLQEQFKRIDRAGAEALDAINRI